ncbi:MAG: alpha/beta fold hydrolase [Flavobacteriaceae bacterium]|nr:alpha/beta fold hydrolase [Flavobacteriaceae bacterium]
MILHSKIIGTGTPVLILHGYFGMSDNWKTIGTQISKQGFEVHLIDQRNHGRSFHTEEFDYDLMCEDLYNYIEHYDLKEVVLLGHSMGGKTAMLFSVTYPEKVSKLVVADISPRYYQPHHNLILKALNSVDFSVQKTRKEVEEVLRNYIKEEGVLMFLLKNVYSKTKEQLAFRFNLKSLTNNNSEVGEGLPSFTVFEKETLFLKGENSEYITQEDMPLISAHFPNSSVKTIENAGHWLHAEQPKRFLEVFLGFVRG